MTTRTVAYDSECSACRAIVSLMLLYLPRNVDVVPFDTLEGREILNEVPDAERGSSWVFRDESGGVATSVDATKKILELRGFGRFLTTLMLHRCYPSLSRRRGILGRFLPKVDPIYRVSLSCHSRPRGTLDDRDT